MDTPTMFEPTTVGQRVQPPPDTVLVPGSREPAGPWLFEPPDPHSLSLPFDPCWDVVESWSAVAESWSAVAESWSAADTEPAGTAEPVGAAELAGAAEPAGAAGAVSTVFEANSGLASGCGPVPDRTPGPCGSVAEGFSGFLGLGGVPELGPDLTGTALQGLRRLEGWTAASRARLVHRQHLLMRAEVDRFRLQREAQDAQRRAAGTVPAEKAGHDRKAGPGIKAGGGRKAGSDRSLAFSLAAAEIATLLGIPRAPPWH